MKCDNCGKEEVNFHYTSNINGNISEKHLCAECAGKLGYAEKLGLSGRTDNTDKTDKTGPDASFEEIFADLFGAMPSRRMLGGFGVMFPTIVIPAVFVPGGGAAESGAAQPGRRAEIKAEVDIEMKKRRELNILREQMRQAAAAEDFERAAQLRDTVRKLEAGESV